MVRSVRVCESIESRILDVRIRMNEALERTELRRVRMIRVLVVSPPDPRTLGTL